MDLTGQVNERFRASQAGYCTQQSTSTHTHSFVSKGFFQHLLRRKANLIYISMHTFMKRVIILNVYLYLKPNSIAMNIMLLFI